MEPRNVPTREGFIGLIGGLNLCACTVKPDELAVLFADGRPHVVLIDDLRCYDGGTEHHLEDHYADYPHLDWLADQAETHGYDWLAEDDIGRLTPR